ncbi:MAG: radical SAM protein [Verrucomicrobia bacterium]|nr:radical SAM protein [Verrucomicrobiota bacterium]MBU4291651.1 radical SAM protein [Verrucomicrobiota bacterium]MBU4428475.1 radical SAM protein [Verrucomicrobiota bacterium]MBU4498413.1 radical SAM protein [Verrucomicrobiota bacterium]MCG2679042.1 radical SAM protein [Kiritimatiellia bacterium]
MLTPDNNPLFRPPAEADSLILQVVCGCAHNQCAFCGMYKDIPFRRRAPDELRRLIESETRRHRDARRVFLGDGDVLCLPFEDLRLVLAELADRLPELARVNAYANGCSIMAHTDTALRELRRLKLHTLYMGLESGDPATLARMQKSDSVETMIAAGRRSQAAGLRMSVMILLGLAGRERSRDHAAATAAALNRIQPRLLSALRVIPVPGTVLDRDIAKDRFHPLTEYEVIVEIKTLVEHLDLTATVFRANHSSNVIPLEARFPRDRQALLESLQTLLDSGRLDRHSPGPLPFWL